MNVYFVQAGHTGPIKIGLANNVEKRIATLQTGNHIELRLIAVFPCKSRQHAEYLEKGFHKKFIHKKVRGEWFSPTIRLCAISELDSLDINPEQKEHDMDMIDIANGYI